MAYFDVDRRAAGILPGGTSGSVQPPPGPKYVPEYQVSGQPYVKFVTQDGSTNELTFPYMTQWIIVTNHGTNAMKIGFSAAGLDSNSNYFQIDGQTPSPKLDIRTKSIYYDGTNLDTFSVIAGLTNIATGSIADYEASTYWGT